MPPGPLYLGFDSSTQSLKVTAVNPKCEVVARYALSYQTDLPASYGLKGGVVAKPGNVVVQPTVMVRRRVV